MWQENPNPGSLTSTGDSEAIQHLKQAIADGRPWHIALLEAINLWSCPEESRNGNHYCYLIDGEAFDWLLLAERLCEEVASQIPEQELIGLLFFGRLPEALSEEDFRKLIGSAKYRAYLNYFYGVIVEEYILLAVEEEICKENRPHAFYEDKTESADIYRRVYGVSQEDLLRRFRDDKGYPHSDTISIGQLREFIYWLFKYRMTYCDKAKVASDTKKGLEYFRRQLQLSRKAKL